MKASDIFSALNLLVQARQPVFVWGQPGIGKSDVMAQVAKARKIPLLDIRALLLDPVDLRGLPYLEATDDPSCANGHSYKQAKWASPDFLPTSGEGILFLDELNAAAPMVQASCYQLVLDRKLGDYRLPDGWAIAAAGNRQTDRAVTHQMPTPLKSRFTHLDFEVDLNDWCQWAIQNSIRPEIIAFLRFKPELLSDFDRDKTAFPTPRTWAFVSNILNQQPAPVIENALIAGTVGDGAATAFAAFLKTFRELPNVDAILMSPDTERVPTEASALHAVAGALSYAATGTNFDRVYRYLQRMPPEFTVFSVRDALLRTPDVKHSPAFTRFAVEHHQVLS
jgi:MoxR-like ATPase